MFYNSFQRYVCSHYCYFCLPFINVIRAKINDTKQQVRLPVIWTRGGSLYLKFSDVIKPCLYFWIMYDSRFSYPYFSQKRQAKTVRVILWQLSIMVLLNFVAFLVSKVLRNLVPIQNSLNTNICWQISHVVIRKMNPRSYFSLLTSSQEGNLTRVN